MCLGFEGLSIQLRSNLSTRAVTKLILSHRRNKTAKRTAWMIFGRAGSLTDSRHFPPAHLERIYLKSQTLLLFSLTPQHPISFQYLINPCEISPPSQTWLRCPKNAVQPPQVLSSAVSALPHSRSVQINFSIARRQTNGCLCICNWLHSVPKFFHGVSLTFVIRSCSCVVMREKK